MFNPAATSCSKDPAAANAQASAKIQVIPLLADLSTSNEPVVGLSYTRADNLVVAMTDCSPEIEAKLIAPSAQELLKLPEHIKALGFHISETRPG